MTSLIPGHSVRQVIYVLLLLYLLLLVTISAYNIFGAETWWFTGANLYAPQAMWAVPGLILIPFMRRSTRSAKISLAAAILWVVGPMMGFNVPLRKYHARPADVTIRVLTYNVKWAHRDATAEAADIARFAPDVIQFQDSSGVLDSAIGDALAGYHVEESGQFIVASKIPLSKLRDFDISFAGSRHHVCRGAVKVGRVWVALYDVHLLSPREGLRGIRHHNIEFMQDNIGARVAESSRLAGYVSSEKGPVMLTGDFNAPIQSVVCRNIVNTGLSDAFCDSGFGYGYTYGAFTKAQSSYVRIDHIFYNNRLASNGCWVGNRIGSDHCPVIADIVVKNAR